MLFNSIIYRVYDRRYWLVYLYKECRLWNLSKKMIKNLKKKFNKKKWLKIWKKYVLKCFCLYICVLYNVIVLMDKVLIVYLNLYLDVSEGICVV